MEIARREIGSSNRQLQFQHFERRIYQYSKSSIGCFSSYAVQFAMLPQNTNKRNMTYFDYY